MSIERQKMLIHIRDCIGDVALLREIPVYDEECVRMQEKAKELYAAMIEVLAKEE